MNPPRGSDLTADLEVLPVEHLSEYVIGFPMHAAITVRAHPTVNFRALPFADFLNLRSCIGVEIIGQAPIMPKPFVDPDSGKGGSPLGGGETRRMLIDFSHLVAGAVKAGEYRVRFSYVEPYGSYAAEPVTLRFRNPTPGEATQLGADDWDRWTITCPEHPDEGAIADGDPLRFNRVVRRLLCTAEPDPATLDVLTGLYQPERDAFKAELYKLAGDQARYEQLRSQILARTPGMAWWLRMIDGGGAFVKSLRTR